MARITDAIGLHRRKRLSCVEASELFGDRRAAISPASGRLRGGGCRRSRGRASGRREPLDEIEWVVVQFTTRNFDFTAKHFHEAILGAPMADRQPFSGGFTWTKRDFECDRVNSVP